MIIAWLSTEKYEYNRIHSMYTVINAECQRNGSDISKRIVKWKKLFFNFVVSLCINLISTGKQKENCIFPVVYASVQHKEIVSIMACNWSKIIYSISLYLWFMFSSRNKKKILFFSGINFHLTVYRVKKVTCHCWRASDYKEEAFATRPLSQKS